MLSESAKVLNQLQNFCNNQIISMSSIPAKSAKCTSLKHESTPRKSTPEQFTEKSRPQERN